MGPPSILIRLDNGDITNIVPDVEDALAGGGKSSLAHRALARISNLCIKCSGQTEPVIKDDNVALQLVLICCRAIDVDSHSDSVISANSRTILSLYNALSRFYSNGNTLCAIKTLDGCLPILKKMVLSVSEDEKKHITKILSVSQCIISTASNSIYKEDQLSDLTPYDLWDRMLQVSSLATSDVSLIPIFSVMRGMVIKYENCHGSLDTERILNFNEALLDNLQTHFETTVCKLVAEKDVVDKLFGLFVSTYWQFLRTNIRSGSAERMHKTIFYMSKFAKEMFRHFSKHMQCFDLIDRLLRVFLFQADSPPEENFFLCEVESLTKTMKPMRNHSLPKEFTWVVFMGGCCATAIERVITSPVCLKSFFTRAVLSAIYNFAVCLSELLLECSTSPCTGATGEICPYEGDALMAFKSVNMFIVLCLERDSKELWQEMLPSIEDSFKNLQSISNTAAANKCVKGQWMKQKLYEIYWLAGKRCSDSDSWAHGQKFYLGALHYHYDANVNDPKNERVFYLLSRLFNCCEKQGLRNQAKAIILLHVMLHLKFGTPQQPYFCEKWCLLQNEDPAEANTAHQFMKAHSSLMKSMWSDFSINSKLVPNLMLWELSCYTTNRMKSPDMILNAWLALKTSKPSMLFLIEGSALASQALFSSSDTVAWYDLLSTSLPSWLSKVNLSEKGVALCAMGVHHYTKFLIMAQSHFNENQSTVDEVEVYTQNPLTVRKPEDVINPSDVCEIRSSFPNLNLHREQMLIEELETAVNYWNDSLEAGLSVDDHAMHSIVSTSGECLLQTAYLYSLWGFNAGAVRAFHVCSKFARKMCLDDLLLQALSGLMNTIEVKQDCIAEAESLLERLKNHHKIHYLSKVYKTSCAFHALRTKAYSQGLKVLQDVTKDGPSQSTMWCYSYAKLLEASYATLPKSKRDKPEACGTVSACKGLRLCISNIQERRLSHSPLIFAAVVNQVLLSSLWIGRHYLHLQMPREARCFLKPELKLALKLGLATRAAEFICELAFIDLITEKVDEAVAKVNDLQGILSGDDQSPEHCAENIGDTDELDNSFTANELVPPKDTRNILGASPVLGRKNKFNIIVHELSCKCYMCKNYSVQNVWLMYGHLQAKVNMLQFEIHSSTDMFKKSFQAAKSVLQKLSQDASLPGSLLQQHQIACTEVFLWLDFVDMLVAYQKDQEARKSNEKVLVLLDHMRTDEDQLLAQALEQKLCIIEILDKKNTDKSDSKTLKNTVTSHCLSPPRIFVEKTPEKGGSTPKVPKVKREPLKRRVVQTPKNVIFPVSDQQFATPKAEIKLILEDSDDDNDHQAVQQAKENVSNALQKSRKVSKVNTESKASKILKNEVRGTATATNALPQDVKAVTSQKTASTRSTRQAPHRSKPLVCSSIDLMPKSNEDKNLAKADGPKQKRQISSKLNPSASAKVLETNTRATRQKRT